MEKKILDKPFLVSYDVSFCHKCKKFFNNTKTSYCPSCNVCSEDLCIVCATVDIEELNSEEEPKIKSLTVDAIQGYMKDRKFYESKNILSKGELYLKTEMMDTIKEEVKKSFEFVPEQKNKKKNK